MEVLLGLLTIEPMSGYDLGQTIRASVGHFWNESYGQIYPNLKKLAAAGLCHREDREAEGQAGPPGLLHHEEGPGAAGKVAGRGAAARNSAQRIAAEAVLWRQASGRRSDRLRGAHGGSARARTLDKFTQIEREECRRSSTIPTRPTGGWRRALDSWNCKPTCAGRKRR